jgi:hypothetical protein
MRRWSKFRSAAVPSSGVSWTSAVQGGPWQIRWYDHRPRQHKCAHTSEIPAVIKSGYHRQEPKSP